MADTSIDLKPDLVDILARCELFTSLTSNERDRIASLGGRQTIPPGSLLVSEGVAGAAMYVLLEGVLEVFTVIGGEEVILHRVEEVGAHIGEKALLDSSEGSHRASVRSLTYTHVLRIPKAVFLEALQVNPSIEEHLQDVHDRQLKQQSLVERSAMYRTLVLFDQEHGWSREEYFEPGTVIVSEGDPPSAVYVVRSGTVKRCRIEAGEEVVLSVLHEGQTFGGLAVLEDRPHSAAAIATSNVELVTFDREQFLQATAAVPELHAYLGAVNRIYAMSGGLATLFDGEFRGEPALVTIVQLDDGRDLICNHVIDRAIYSASIEIPPAAWPEEFSYRDDKRQILRTLTVNENQLVQVHVEGPWDELGRVHTMLLERAPVNRDDLLQFPNTGHLLEPSPAQLAVGPDAIMCECLGLTRLAVETAIVHGAETLEVLSRETGATTVCGSCTTAIASMLSNAGQYVRMCEEIEVTREVRSFRFMPDSDANDGAPVEQFWPSLAGQHVVISAEIDGAWIQRPYTITSSPQRTDWREITVKREDHGYLSNWLFTRPESPRMTLSRPKGDFWVDPELGETVVCLVAGIGMTPALAIARAIIESGSSQVLHIDYSARTRVDFAYRSELDAAPDNITVNYRATGGRQHLSADDVAGIFARYPNARFLVCGPHGYMLEVHEMLNEAGAKDDRIHLEVFTSIGHAPDEPPEEPRLTARLHMVATLALSVLYLIQSAFGWGLSALVSLQESDNYRIATGSLLLAYIGYQWYLPFKKLTASLTTKRFKGTQTTASWHRYLGVLAPILLYLHSVSLGFAYTFVLALVFVLNAMVGAIDRGMISDVNLRRRYHRFWLLGHVPTSFLITTLAIVHTLYALAYK